VARHPAIQVLVNNAAIARKKREESADGIELTLAVNHVAAFELTRLLLPALTRGAPSRVITVSSAAQRRKEIVLDDLQNLRRRYGGVRVYGETKLMNVLFTRELARRTAGTGVMATCCHPGVIGTDGLLNYFPAFMRPIVALVTGTPARGADTPIWLATSPAGDGASGGYYIGHRLARPNPRANDTDLAQRLWSAPRHWPRAASGDGQLPSWITPIRPVPLNASQIRCLGTSVTMWRTTAPLVGMRSSVDFSVFGSKRVIASPRA
jgi:NAD(P)-dependent dehydrogenase (short-subunit alcohol dehydrogenase family)